LKSEFNVRTPVKLTYGFCQTQSTKSTPKFAKNHISNFHISPNWGRFAPTLDNFYQNPKTIMWQGQPSAVGPIRANTAAILTKNVRRGGSTGQTGSRNMAATRFLDFSTPTSYSTSNTLWGLSRTVTELSPGGVTITPLLRPPDLAKIFKVRRAILPISSAHCSSSTRQNFMKFSESLARTRSCRTQSKNRKSDDTFPSKSRPKYAKMPKFKPPYLPQVGADSPQIKSIFLRVARAIRF